MKINFSGRLYDIVAYETEPETGLIDMDAVRELAIAEQPKVIVAGWSAYTRQLDFAKFREIADEVGAALWVDMAHFAGLVAAGLHPSPVPYADVVSTTIHKTIGGPRSGMILCTQKWAKKIDSAVFPGQQGGPLMHVIAAKAVALKLAGTDEFKDRQSRTLEGARILAERLQEPDARDAGVKVVSGGTDRKSTRLNSSHVAISYAVLCLKKKNNEVYNSYIFLNITLYTSYHLRITKLINH